MTCQHTIEAVLLSHPTVYDCAVRLRQTESLQHEWVAYVALVGSTSVEALQLHLARHVSTDHTPVAIVPVSTLPLTSEGQLDEHALETLAVIDEDLIQRWEHCLKSQPGVQQAVVTVQNSIAKSPPLHLSDLLPHWRLPAGSSLQSGTAFSVGSRMHQPARATSGVLAISQGEPLQTLPNQPNTLAEALKRAAQRSPQTGILYLQPDGSESAQSYAALLTAAAKILAGLKALGIQPQAKVIFQLDRHQDFIPAFWACILGGFVPVPLSTAITDEASHSTVSKLINVWQTLEQPLVLCSQKVVSTLYSVANRSGLEHFQVAAIDDLWQHPPDFNWHVSHADDLAVLIMTSGSTGTPKGVMLSHRNILSNVASSAQMNGLTPADVTLNWLRLDHVGSLVRCCIRDIYIGCQQIQAPTEMVLEEPLRWLDWIEQYKVTFAWAPNFALALVNQRLAAVEPRTWNLASLRSLLSVAEAIQAKTARKFLDNLAPCGLSPQAMHSAWGMSETAAAIVVSHQYLLALPSERSPFVEVGQPIPGAMIRIVNPTGQTIEEGAIGALEVKGSMVSCGYYQNPDLAQDAFTEDGWLKTGDLGFLCDGRLTVVGRQKDIIIINGLNHYSHEVEAIVESLPGVEASYTAACAIRTPDDDTDQLAIFFHTPHTDDDRLIALLKEIRETVTRGLQVTPAYLIPVAKATIPKTPLGKIQRSQLKQRFEAGEFEHVLKQLDILTANANTVPDWFYQKVWQRKEAITLSTQSRTGATLVFLDAIGLGELLCKNLHEPCIKIAIGTEFQALDSRHYCIDPQKPDHYQQLLNSITEANGAIGQILHLWTYGSDSGDISSLSDLEQAQNFGIYSLLFLVQALNRVQNSQQPVRLFAISSNAQSILPQAKIAYEKTPILGLIKTLPQEMPWLDCRHLDLSAERLATDTTCVLQEIQVIQPQREVAYRNHQRFIPRLQKVDRSQASQQSLPFKNGGIYLLSGGLGGIAVEIAKYLLEHYSARLLLIGRTPLPDPLHWHHCLQQEDKVAARIQAYQSLKQLGGDVMYEAIDICDWASIQQSVSRAKSRWHGELDGVIHLAGIGPERLLLEETRDTVAATLAPKVFGTWNLHQLVKNRPESIFIHVSSVISFQGALMVGAYAAANHFLDGFWHYQTNQSKLRSYCFSSSTWSGIGISRGYEMRDSRYAQGREVISKEQGLHSFLASLYYGPSHLLVGLDGNHPQVHRHRSDTSPQIQNVHAYFTSTVDQKAVETLQSLTVRDRFGTLSTCECHQVEAIPVTEAATVDVAKLMTKGTRQLEATAPRTPLEKILADIWQDILKLSKVSVHDNFFELGGSSLLAMQMFAQIEQAVGRKLPLATLFQAPTVEELAVFLQADTSVTSLSPLVAIQPHGSKLPLFCIHEVTGNVFFYRDLANQLGSDQPIYGLQAQGLNRKQAPLNQLDVMAAHYVATIRIVQPEGPYALIGYSLGGMIAFEIAQQLQAQGQKVALLALIDTYHTAGLKRLPFPQRMCRHAKNFSQIGPRYIFSKHRLKWYLGRVQAKLDAIAPNFRSQAKHFTPHFQDSSSELIAAHRQAVEAYTPKLYPGRIVFFQASNPLSLGGWDYNPQRCWSQLAARGLDLCKIPGDHESIIREPRVQVLAKALRTYLDEPSISS